MERSRRLSYEQCLCGVGIADTVIKVLCDPLKERDQRRAVIADTVMKVLCHRKALSSTAYMYHWEFLCRDSVISWIVGFHTIKFAIPS